MKQKAINLLSVIVEELTDEQFELLRNTIQELDETIRNI